MEAFTNVHGHLVLSPLKVQTFFHISIFFSTGTRRSRVAGLPVKIAAGMKKNVYEAKFL